MVKVLQVIRMGIKVKVLLRMVKLMDSCKLAKMVNYYVRVIGLKAKKMDWSKSF